MVFNSLTIGGINSLDYGIYITGEGVYDAPNRAVEMVEIHGRNGALILDKGHYENIEIKYPCGSFGESGKTFEQRITDFKNAVLSLRGYQRLTDTYATDVYRLASCANGFEVAPVQGGKAGEFDLVFNCKPQRFLTSGETLVTVANNGTVTNPTQFDSQPTIQVNGYGTLTFNGYEVTVENAMMGEVDIVSSVEVSGSQIYINNSLFNGGDAIHATFTVRYRFLYDGVYANEFTVLSSSGVSSVKTQNNTFYVTYSANFTAGTNATRSPSILVRVSIKGTSTSDDVQISPSIAYSSTSKLIDISSYTPSSSDFDGSAYMPFDVTATADSTIGILGNPTYIDCELGEAYKIVDGQFVSLNRYIDLGSDLPTLAPGTNTFTKSNTITSLKVKPNWWKL